MPTFAALGASWRGAGTLLLRDMRCRAMPAGKSKLMAAAAGFVTAFMLSGCAHSPAIWNHYDECAGENQSFVAMTECGRKKRLAECVPNNNCSPEGTQFMEYMDSLALSVKDKKLTEVEAMRRYVEYKSGGASR